MTLIYKDFTITGTVKEIKEFIELMENNKVTSNLDIPELEEYLNDTVNRVKDR